MEKRHGWRRAVRAGGLALAAVLLSGALAFGATASREKGAEQPNYTLPNLVSVIMCVVVLAIPCKRFRRT